MPCVTKKKRRNAGTRSAANVRRDHVDAGAGGWSPSTGRE